MSETKLLPCPFCGKTPTIGVVGGDVPGMEDCRYSAIECCDVHIHRDSDEEAAEAWNRRAPSPVVMPEVVEEALKAVDWVVSEQDQNIPVEHAETLAHYIRSLSSPAPVEALPKMWDAGAIKDAPEGMYLGHMISWGVVRTRREWLLGPITGATFFGPLPAPTNKEQG